MVKEKVTNWHNKRTNDFRLSRRYDRVSRILRIAIKALIANSDRRTLILIASFLKFNI
jgi:hypothetical protein